MIPATWGDFTRAWAEDAVRAADAIVAKTGKQPGELGNYPSTTIKTELRRFAVAMGVDTHAARDGRVTTEQLRALYDGTTTASAIMAGLDQPATPTPTKEPTPMLTADLARTAQNMEARGEYPAAPPSRPIAPPTPAQGDAVANVAAALAQFMASQTPTAAPIDAEAVGKIVDQRADAIAERAALHMANALPELVRDEVAKHVRTVEIKIPELPSVKIDTAHKDLPTILQAIVAGCSPMLVGPAGSGKTTLAHQIATALGRAFHMAARVTSEYAMIGFIDAGGTYHRTAFRDAYEHGGVFLFDEVDASDPDALTAFNAALANGHTPFPDGLIERHRDFAAIAAGNTFGRGADRQYVGRNQLDAATLDRFQVFTIDYDEKLELALAGNDAWTRQVQRTRAAVEREKVRHIISPRASIMGARMLAAGMDKATVEEATIWKGLDETARARVVAAIRGA